MGYTHYWRQKRAFTADEWTRITAEAKRIVAKATRALYSGPETYATATAADQNEFGFAVGFGQATAWRTFPHPEIKPAMQGEVIRICGGDGAGQPEFTADYISLNGCAAEKQDYESFVIERAPVVPEWIANNPRELERTRKEGIFNCVKTEYRNYDPVVVSILAAARTIAPDAITLSSDGGPDVFQMMF